MNIDKKNEIKAESPAMIFRPVDFVLDELRAKNISKRSLLVKIKKLIEKFPERRSWWFREFISGKHLPPRGAIIKISENLDHLGILPKYVLIASYDNFMKHGKSGLYRYDKKLKCLVKRTAPSTQ